MVTSEQQLEGLIRQARETREVIYALAQRVTALEGLFNALYDRVVAPDGTDRGKTLEQEVAYLKGQLARLLAGPGPTSVKVEYPIPGTAYPVSIPGTANPSPPGEPGPNVVPRYEGD